MNMMSPSNGPAHDRRGGRTYREPAGGRFRSSGYLAAAQRLVSPAFIGVTQIWDGTATGGDLPGTKGRGIIVA